MADISLRSEENEQAQNNLKALENKQEMAASLYQQGEQYYSNQEYGKAVECFRRSAELGDAEGQYGLGVCYAEGTGVEKNEQEAVKWYRKAAEWGDAAAQKHLRRLGQTW